jgi:hypothetical protein
MLLPLMMMMMMMMMMICVREVDKQQLFWMLMMLGILITRNTRQITYHTEATET